MKRRGLILSLVFLICMVFAAPVLAAPTVNLDGKQLTFDVQPTIENGRTLVPLRAIFEAMGANVDWNQSTQTATATKDGTIVKLRIGSITPTINGQVKTLDVPAKIVNGRTLAPLRFVGEAFGGTVGWDPATQKITILTVTTIQGPVKVHFIDVGQADSIYIELPNNNDILIDAGNRSDGPTVVSYLRAQGVDDIELLIATHPHEDHIGGIPDVMDAFVVEKVLDSGYYSDTAICKQYKSKVAAEDCVYQADSRQTFNYENVVLQILTGAETWKDTNDYSVVCRLDTGDIEFLFTGDAEIPVEKILTGELASEILKVGHHGSTSSTSTAFLSKVKPEVAVICVGTGNTYGHPHQETLTKLKSAGAKIYRTDLNGNIVITTDGQSYTVKTAKSLPEPSQEENNVTPSVPDSGKYVGSSNSNKYHLPTCRYAESIAPENKVWFKDINAAQAAGYEPCGVCKP